MGGEELQRFTAADELPVTTDFRYSRYVLRRHSVGVPTKPPAGCWVGLNGSEHPLMASDASVLCYAVRRVTRYSPPPRPPPPGAKNFRMCFCVGEGLFEHQKATVDLLTPAFGQAAVQFG